MQCEGQQHYTFSYTHTHTHMHIHTRTHTHTLTQVGAMVAYLCTDEARQVTGATLSIDGGWTIQ